MKLTKRPPERIDAGVLRGAAGEELFHTDVATGAGQTIRIRFKVNLINLI